MNIENPFEGSEFEDSLEREDPRREIFWDTLNQLIAEMEESEEMTAREAQQKREAGSLIRTGFTDDPAYDAYVFSIAEWVPEERLVEHFEEKGE